MEAALSRAVPNTDGRVMMEFAMGRVTGDKVGPHGDLLDEVGDSGRRTIKQHRCCAPELSFSL